MRMENHTAVIRDSVTRTGNRTGQKLERVLLLCLLSALALCGTALAHQKSTDIRCPVAGGFLFFDKAAGTITGHDGAVGPDLVIPREIDGTPVTIIGSSAIQFNAASSVVIPDTVTTIESYAFQHSDNLKTVVIPDSVRTIGKAAFSRCGLTSLTIPSGVTEIESEAFEQCAFLTSAAIFADLEELPSAMFDGCTRLKSVALPSGLKRIGKGAFSRCPALETIQLPDGLTHIEAGAFSNSGLKELPLPASLEEIGADAFSWCGNLSHVTLPAGVLLGPRLFRYSSLYSVTFSDGITSIPENTFESCYNLFKVRLPKSLTRIGESAFFGCNGLTKVVIPRGVTEIANQAFMGCTMSSVTIPRSVTSIGGNALSPGGVSKVDYYYEGTKAELNAIPKLDLSGDPPYYTTSLHYNSPMPDTEYLQPIQEPFADVPEDSYFTLPVQWAATAGVTGGTSPTTFSPYDTCTMAQAVAFLWRAAGRPLWWDDDVHLPSVPKNAYYADAAHRAYERGAIDASFQPNAPCTRAALVDMIWKINNAKEIGAIDPNRMTLVGENTMGPGGTMVPMEGNQFYFREYAATAFSDVPADSPYASAIGWALYSGVTNGTSDTTFTPDKVCTRAQVVSILFRANGKGLLSRA